MECLMILLSQVIGWLIYLPFFKIADAQAYKQEQEAKAAQAAQEEEPQLVLDSAQAI